MSTARAWILKRWSDFAKRTSMRTDLSMTSTELHLIVASPWP